MSHRTPQFRIVIVRLFDRLFKRQSPPPRPEIQGIWIAGLPHSGVLASKESIKEAFGFLKEKGFNTVFPVVWNRGYTLFPSREMKRYGFKTIDPYYEKNCFDPLQVCVDYAKEFNLKIIPWFEYGFASSPEESGGHILESYPEWGAVSHTGEKLRGGGLIWMNALDRRVQEFILSLILEVVDNYDVDGVQGCDRLPALPVAGGYNRDTLRQYRDFSGSSSVPLPTNPNWIRWRADRLTDFLEGVYREVKKINPKLILSLSPAVYPFCLNNLLQDPKAWIQRGIVDSLHPQIYRGSFNDYRNEARKQKNYLNGGSNIKIAPGVAFRANNRELSEGDLKKIIACNHSLGFNGLVFFHYEGLKGKNIP